MAESEYLFGDSDLAARRLELLARVFSESTRAFLSTAGERRRAVAIDLGCGAGFTTHLIAGVLRCDRVLGLDASPRLLELALPTARADVSFARHDINTVPLPAAPVDLIFCRFLLTHLSDPRGAVAKWATQLNPAGVLMIEETEAIRTRHPVFARYLEAVEAMLASRSNALYAGRMVASLKPASGLKMSSSRLERVAVRNGDAARMFAMNLEAWKERDFIRTNYPDESINGLLAELMKLAEDRSAASEIEWSMRQVILER